jgi:hypothetical protein
VIDGEDEGILFCAASLLFATFSLLNRINLLAVAFAARRKVALLSTGAALLG